jgi:hypothetical protein
MRYLQSGFGVVMLSCCAWALGDVTAGDWAKMLPITPRGYVCYRARAPITVDGKADEASWADAPWTDDFVDIEGSAKSAPRFRTRAKMLWDDQYLYVFAELEEPHVWGTLRKKNDIIFYDNDFEVFINPAGDNHNYYEFEMNALNTIWELTLDKPYRDGGPAHHGTNLDGLKSAVHVDGTLNDLSDKDRGWSVEIAFPWKGLARYVPAGAAPPKDGEQWRLGFSRVEWLVNIVDGKYQKLPREQHPEDNWVWSPQGVIDMHRPERWGYVQFSTAEPGKAAFKPDPTLPARDALMGVYYAEREIHRTTGKYAATLADLRLQANSSIQLTLSSRESGYVASAQIAMPGGWYRELRVTEDSKITEVIGARLDK